MTRKFQRLTWAFLAFLPLVGCQNNPLDVDVSGVDVDINIIRFDKELFEMPLENLDAEHQRFQAEYGSFYDDFVERIAFVGAADDSDLSTNFKPFITDPDHQELALMVSEHFPNLDAVQAEFEGAFKHFRYHFPDAPVPVIYTFMSGLNARIAVDSTYLGIGLEWYLGEECPYYPIRGFPKYLTDRMIPENLVLDAMKGWVSTEFDYNKKGENLLRRVVYEGKIMYAMDALFPNRSDAWKMGYTPAQLAWCQEFESRLWGHFVEKQLFFSTKQKDIAEYTNDGPFTSDFQKESPARTGSWLGWQIVRSYMSEHPEVSLAELMADQDAQRLLNRSGYRP